MQASSYALSKRFKATCGFVRLATVTRSDSNTFPSSGIILSRGSRKMARMAYQVSLI